MDGKKLEGKVVILTGASMGLGKQIAIYLSGLGVKLTICARRIEKLMDTARLCEQAGGEVLALPCDVSQYDQLKNLVDKTVERFGTIDALLNNANLEAVQNRFENQTIQDLEDAFHIGVYAHWNLMKLCFPYLKGKNSSIINFVSAVYQMGMPGQAAYVADKGAIRGLSMTVAREWGKYGIRVNTLAPSAMTDTIYDKLPPEYRDWVIKNSSLNCMNRLGLPETDIPPVVAFLISEDSGWISGQNINVDGGACVYSM